MNRKFLATLVLASGMALAQTGSNSAGTPLPGQNPQSGQSSATASSSPSSQQTFRGCLRQSGGNWTLSENGQDMAVTGDDSMLKPHDGQQVEVQGTQPAGSSLQVTSLTTISSSCIGQAPSSSATKPEGNTNSNATDQTATPPKQNTPSTGPPNTQPTNNPPMSGTSSTQGTTGTTPSSSDQTAKPPR